MRWAYAVIIAIILFVVLALKWRHYRQSERREDGTAFVMYLLAGTLVLLLTLFPNLPGPTQVVDFLFGPFGQYLKK